jgi:hypothetical protein
VTLIFRTDACDDAILELLHLTRHEPAVAVQSSLRWRSGGNIVIRPRQWSPSLSCHLTAVVSILRPGRACPAQVASVSGARWCVRACQPGCRRALGGAHALLRQLWPATTLGRRSAALGAGAVQAGLRLVQVLQSGAFAESGALAESRACPLVELGVARGRQVAD